jgi:endonuclease I
LIERKEDRAADLVSLLFTRKKGNRMKNRGEMNYKIILIFMIWVLVLSGCGISLSTEKDSSREVDIDNQYDNSSNSTDHILDDTYYQSALEKEGKELKRELHEIIREQSKLSYKEVWEALKETDEDPNNPNHVILFYTGRSQSKEQNGPQDDEWNREHIWAKSHGNFGTEIGPGTDLHHLRPTDVSVNRDRNDLDFDFDEAHRKNPNESCGDRQHEEAPDTCYDEDSWEPRDEVKGDIARMLFYMAVRYEGNGEPDLEVVDRVNTSGPTQGKLSTLLEWHKQDPVDDVERRRNDIIYENYQHNRNPFIDHPEWVELIW